MKKSTKSLLLSGISLLLCIAMLAGTTLAWFTDSVSSGLNVINGGNLDIEMYWSTDLNGLWINAEDESAEAVFNYDKWEPGYTEVRYVKIVNAGSLAFKYALSIIANGEVSKLADVIDVYFIEAPTANIGGRAELDNMSSVGTLRDAIEGKIPANGVLLPNGKSAEGFYSGEIIVAIALKMRTDVGNDYMGLSACEGGFSLRLDATQYDYEKDSFGDDYDNGTKFPEMKNFDIVFDVPVENGAVINEITVQGDNFVVTVPAGVKTQGTLGASVKEKDHSDANITVGDDQIMRPVDVHVEGLAEDNTVPIIINLGEVMPKGLNIGNYTLYHVENGTDVAMTAVGEVSQLDVHNEFFYDPATGEVTVAMASFSEVALVADTENAWEGEFDYTWYDASKTELTIANADQLAAFGAIVGGMKKVTGRVDNKYTYSDEVIQDSFKGKTVKLIADINLGDKESENNPDIIFYPIGYWNNEGTYERKPVEERTTAVSSGLYTFNGTFDGNGHTVSNFYQNTWEMKGDHDWYSPEEQYYRDGMGLFGRVYKGTVKNLTVREFKSDGEIATTGVIAAYADGATFENIAIFNCNPRVYNIGNGGIVGCVGWYAKEANLKTTFKNITVDNSNKISALWGSYDVACGGIVGQYYPTSGQSSAGTPKNGGVHFENCHMSAQMDVYNDVCANYQYYAYRYTGMLIGSVRENVTIDGHSYPKMDGITAKDCTVHFGTWNDYYYCEFEKNGHPSYSGPDDYKFSRIPHSEINFTDSNGNGIIDTDEERASVTGCKHEHTAAENNQAVYLPFNNLVTGYGWGVTTKVVGELEGVTILDREEGTSVEKFEGKVTELVNNKTYKLGDIFKFVDKGVKLVPGALAVGITNLGEGNPVSATIVYDRENWENGTITLTGTGEITITIQDYFFCTPTTITVNVKDRQPEEKFDVVMNNGNFLHRVGNNGTVALDKLFKAKDGVTVGTVSVTVEAVNGTSASGTYSNNAIQFDGTGVVRVTITDNDYCIPTELYLEVVEATNYSGASGETLNATTNNVVLLTNISSSGFTVSDGYAFYGNGFEITCSGDGSYLNATGMSVGYINVKNGVLDNVQVVCDIYPVALLYSSEVYGYENEDRYIANGDKHYYNYQLSAVAVSGDSTISNSYIYGARNNIYVGAGNVNIENTVTECASVSNIHIKSSDAYTVTLDNVTTIQYLTKSKYDQSKNVMGFGILVGDNESESNAKLVLRGDLKQYNWVTSADTDISNQYAKTAITEALKVSTYKYNINDENTVNMGIAVLNSKQFNYEDNRINKEDYPYGLNDITMLTYRGQVYSLISGANITVNNRFKQDIDGVTPYNPAINGNTAPSIDHNKTNGNSLTIKTEYNNGWITTFTADLDNISGGNFAFKFSDLVVKKYGINLDFIVMDSNGNIVDKNTDITLNQLMSKSYTLVVTDDQIYGVGGVLTGNSITHKMAFVIYATKTSIDPPKFEGIGSGVDYAVRLATSSGGEWRPAYPALKGVSVTYWSASEQGMRTIDLDELTSKGTISGQTWTYTCDDYTLTITGGQVHSTDTTYKLTPYVVDGVLYFAGSKAHGTGTTSRYICLEYVFTDQNASTTVGQAKDYSSPIAVVQYAELDEYNWKSFQNGTLEEISSGGGGGCVTGNSLITMADGSKKQVKDITDDDMLLVWDFFNGEFATVPAALIINHGEGEWDVIELYFDDGTVVNAVTAHAFFDADANEFVMITPENASAYIGHLFVKAEGDSYSTAKLVDCKVSKKYTDSYSIVSSSHYNFIVEDMFSLTNLVPDLIAGLEVGNSMKYDENTLKSDIEEYGLYTYEDFAEYVTEEQFDIFNGYYVKISVGKGYLTYNEVVELICGFVNPVEVSFVGEIY